MALNTDFDGVALDAGWSFVQNATANATLNVAGGFASVTIPIGQTSDSISNVSNPDNTAGLVHAISGDFDVAVRIATMVGGQDSTLVNFILRGASDAEMVRWTLFGDGIKAKKYGAARSGGTFNPYQAVQDLKNYSIWHWGHPAWMRAKRVGNVFTFYLSGNGATWVEESSVTIGVDATTLKLSVGQYALLLGEPFRWDKVVDLLAAGTTDARSSLPTLYVAGPQTTEFSTLPAWLSLSSNVDGSATLSGGKVALATAAADQSYGRLTYNGTPKANAGLLCRVAIPQISVSAFAAIGFGVVDGGPNIDQYSAAPLYGIELKLDASGTTIPIRVHRPITYSQAQFDESYTFLATPFPSASSMVWWRFQRYGNRFQIRWWLDGQSEPSTWAYDGEDDLLAGEGDLVPYFAVSHNDGSPALGTLDVHDVSFYELSDTPPPNSVNSSTSINLATYGTVVKTGASLTVGATQVALAASGTVVRTGGDPWLPFADGVTAATGATVTGLVNGVAYEFRVAAVNGAGQGPWSVVATP